MDTVWKKNRPPKFTIIQKCLAFELWILPKTQNNLHSHENFTTIKRLQGEHNPTNFIENKHWMKKIQAPEIAIIKCSLVNSNWLVNINWLPKHLYILDWSENFTTQTRRASTNFPTSFYWIWALDAKVIVLWIGLLECEDALHPLGGLGVESPYLVMNLV